MNEQMIGKKKNGMAVLLLTILELLVAVAVTIAGGIIMDASGNPVLFIIGLIWVCIGWIPFLGLKVLKPQEALVLTLFGKYIGTLRDDGFYFVNPFCVSVNPAAETKLAQSGIETRKGMSLSVGEDINFSAEGGSKKISLKVMTLNNNRQKINDCLGNPIEIGIAVMWRVVDTAKAVFNVDNYKEYLSLQCDSALRDIVRIYPYDVAVGVDTTGDGQADEYVQDRKSVV